MPTTKTKCAKPKGEYCRLHNPTPKFNNLDEVFQKVEQETSVPSSVVFQSIEARRTLSSNCPEDLEEHVEQSQKKLRSLKAHEKIALAGYTGHCAKICNNLLAGRGYEYWEEAPAWRTVFTEPNEFVNREELVDYMKTMDHVVQRRQKNQQVLYRGVPIYASMHEEIEETLGRKLDPEDIDGLVEGLGKYYHAGRILNFPTYLSTTMAADVAVDLAQEKSHVFQPNPGKDDDRVRGVMFEMRTNAGLDITGVTQYDFEREVLLPRDTYFKVVNVYLRPENYDTISNDLYHDDIKIGQDITYKNLAAVVQVVEVDRQGKEILHSKPHQPTHSVNSIVPA
jgi:hypothetical protein